MAQVTLQVVVNDQALDNLTKKVDALNNKRININTGSANKDFQEIESSLGKVNGELTKTVETFSADGKLVKGVNTYKTGINETTQDTQKLNKATGDMVTVSRKVTTDLTKGQKDASNAARQHSDEVQRQGLLYKILGTSLSNFITRIVAYRAIYGVIQKIKQGFTEALKAMKAVDDELVTVRKVTGFSDEQIEGIKNQAYATASKYGAAASDYLSAVAAFSRAGYKELATDLAELSLKTQIVGDVTQDVANQFLISVDAAYKFKGSVEELSSVLDMANEIDNKYATTIEKIAEGMGIVAPVAAQMGVSIEELTAAIGTITAVTQRSGSESARALRALFLNIVGDTKTEIDEGVTWTTGEIAGLRDILRQYAPDAYLAAEATGELIDPMRAIGGLAQAMKDGLLTEQELMEMVSDIGGKLRSSQLLALIQNWDMYESMLTDMQNSAGSADKEIENAMDSWSRKAEVLKNTWTEFLQDTIKTDGIKAWLKLLTDIIKRMDSLAAVLVRVGIAFIGLKLPAIKEGFSKFFDTLKTGASTATRAASSIGLVMTAISIAWSIISYLVEDAKVKSAEAEAARQQAEKEAEEKHRQEVERSRESIERNTESIESLDTLREAYLNIISAKYTEEERDQMLIEWKNKLAEAYGVEEAALAGVNEERRTGIALLDDLSQRELQNAYEQGILAYNEARRFTSDPEGSNVYRASGADWNVLESIYGDTGISATGEQIEGATSGSHFFQSETPGVVLGTGWRSSSRFVGPLSGEVTQERVDNVVDFYGDYATVLENVNLGIDELARKSGSWTAEEERTYESLIALRNELTAEYDEASETISAFLPIMARYNLEINEGISKDSITSAEDFAAALETIREKYEGDESLDMMIQIMCDMFPVFAREVNSATGELDGFVEATGNFADALDVATLALGQNEAALDATATASERASAAQKDAEAAARKFVKTMFDENGQLTATARAALAADSNLASLAKSELEAELAARQSNYTNLVAQIASVGGMAAYARAQLEAMGETTGNPVVDAVKSAVLAAKIRLRMGQAQYEMQQLMSQISTIGAYIPSSGGGGGSSHSGSSGSSGSSSNTDNRLAALQERINLLKSELSLMKARGDSEEDQIAKMIKIQEALKAEENYLRSINGSQIEINRLQEEWWNYQSKIQESTEGTAKAIQDAVDAQIALNNALNERNVHVFNSETGRWEWQANPSNVQSARNALITAAQNLPDGIRENFIREYGITLPGAQSVSNINGTNNYGNTYNFGSFTLTEDQARSMSVYELARLSQTLGVYGNSV